MVECRYSAVLGALLFCPEDSCLSLDPRKTSCSVCDRFSSHKSFPFNSPGGASPRHCATSPLLAGLACLVAGAARSHCVGSSHQRHPVWLREPPGRSGRRSARDLGTPARHNRRSRRHSGGFRRRGICRLLVASASAHRQVPGPQPGPSDSSGWRPPQSFCCFVGELWRCSACRLCTTRCLRFACCSAGPS